MTSYVIPLAPQAQTVTTTLPNGTTVTLRLIYQFNQDDCWILDIDDATGNPIVQGIPLVTGADLLEQYAYLGLGCSLYAATDGDPVSPPHWWNLGSTAQLYVVSPQTTPA